MARPRQYAKRVTTAIRFEPQLHEALSETAHDLGVSINWLVTRLVTEGLERMGDCAVAAALSGPFGVDDAATAKRLLANPRVRLTPREREHLEAVGSGRPS